MPRDQTDYGLVFLPAVDVSGAIVSTDSTNPTSQFTGAGIFAGGLGIEKDVYIGDTLYVLSETTATNPTTGSGVFSGGLGVAKDVYIGQDLYVEGRLYLPQTPYLPTIEAVSGGTLNSVIYNTQSGNYQIAGNVCTVSVNLNVTMDISNPKIGVGISLPIMSADDTDCFRVRNGIIVNGVTTLGSNLVTIVSSTFTEIRYASGTYDFKFTAVYFI